MNGKAIWVLMLTFALFGGSITFAYYLIPSLKANGIVAYLVPFKVYELHPMFLRPPTNKNLDMAKISAVINTVIYAMLGLLIGIGAKLARKMRGR